MFTSALLAFLAAGHAAPTCMSPHCHFRTFTAPPVGRAYGATKMNEHSSRSHVLVMLTVTKRAARVGGLSPIGGAALLARVGKLYLVDLAGSERLKKSMSTGVRKWLRQIRLFDDTDDMAAKYCSNGKCCSPAACSTACVRLQTASWDGGLQSGRT